MELAHSFGRMHGMAFSGVVYCEMEGKQFEATEVCRQRLCDLLYPEGSGYRAVTGGRVENLR